MKGRIFNQGYTVIELAVAMTVLSAGSAVLWYGLKSSSRLDRMNRLHHSALMAARSEMELLRLRPKESIHDTTYALTGLDGESMVLVRQVFDSTRIMASLDDIVLDEKLSPQELRKPLEVKVQVLLQEKKDSDQNSFTYSNSSQLGFDDAEELDQNGRSLVTLILKIPEYRWY